MCDALKNVLSSIIIVSNWKMCTESAHARIKGPKQEEGYDELMTMTLLIEKEEGEIPSQTTLFVLYRHEMTTRNSLHRLQHERSGEDEGT